MKNKFLGFISKWWILLILTFCITAVAIPIIINECYKSDQGYITLWDAPEMLSFYGAYLSFLGTTLVSVIAIYQNHIHIKQSNEKERKSLAIERYALFGFGKIEACFYDEDSDVFYEGKIIENGFNGNKAFWKYNTVQKTHVKLEIEIENIGAYVATNLRIADCNGEKIENTNILHSATGVNNKKYLRCDDKGTAIIIIELKELKEDKPLKYYLTFSNPFENTYNQEIAICSTCGGSIIQIDTSCTLNIKE